MRNAILPSVSSQLYNFGNNEVQMPNLDVSMSMGSQMNVYASGLHLEPNIFNDGNQLRGGGFAVPDQSPVNYQPVAGYQSTFSSCDNISQQSILLCKKDSVPEVDMDFPAIQTRKRSSEATSLLPRKGISDLIDNEAALTAWKRNKRKKATFSEEQGRLQVKESINIQEHKVPVRRSQKLSDKITALQKLVSPYGKTDTASVLQEASLYIKLLQDQIRNSFEMLSNSYNNVASLNHSQETDGKLPNLQSRGLCLVPLSFTHKIGTGRRH